MSVYIVPVNLKRARREIVRDHTKEDRSFYVLTDAELKKLVFRIVSMPGSKLKTFAETLDQKDINSIAE